MILRFGCSDTMYQLSNYSYQITKATPQYSGKSYIESRIDHGNPLYETMVAKAGAGTLLSVGSGKTIVTQRQGNGSYRNYFGLQVPEDFLHSGVDLENLEATRRLLLTHFYADWAEEYKDLIRHATDLRAWPLYTLSAEDLPWKSVPSLTLAGDAAHLSVPNGEGVNLAMTDSLRLAAKIAEHGTEHLDRAVQEYEADMFPRGIDTISAGNAMSGAMFAEDPRVSLQLMTAGEAAE